MAGTARGRRERSNARRRRPPPPGGADRPTAWGLGWRYRPAALVAASPAELALLDAERAAWDVELAWDGHRLLACRADAELRLFADDMREWTGPLAPLVRLLERLPARTFVIDGFACALDAEGRPSFELLRRLASGAREGRLVFAAWDVLHLDGEDLRDRPLAQRRASLEALLAGADAGLVRSAPLDGPVAALRASTHAAGLPGLTARRRAATASATERPLSVACAHDPLPLWRPLSPPPRVTNRDKVLYPRDGITKQAVVDYYAELAPALLPHLRDRPVVSQRWPDGIDDFTWYQHRVPPRAPDYLRAVTIDGDRRVLIDSADALLWMANQAALTFHGWTSRVGSLDSPDWVVLDLDPGEASTWPGLIDVALAVRRLLELLEVPSVVKTSGQKGLHVLVPLGPGHTPAEAHAFARGVAEVIARLMPDVVSLEADRERRRGRLLLDHLQGFVGKSLVLPYSLRAVDGARVSAPLEWSEVTPALDPRAFTLRTMRRRLDAKGELFAPALRGTLRLAPVLAKLR